MRWLHLVFDRITGRALSRAVTRHRAAADALDAAVREMLQR